MTLSARRRLHSAILSVVMILLALICAIPLWIIFINSFKTSGEMMKDPFGLPRSFSLANYAHAFASLPIGRAFLNTVIVTVLSVFIQVFVGSLAAYGMILKKSRFTAAIGTLLVLSFVIPGQTLIIPQYRMMASWGLVDHLASVICIYSGGAAFCYYLIVGYMRELPQSLFEAAARRRGPVEDLLPDRPAAHPPDPHHHHRLPDDERLERLHDREHLPVLRRQDDRAAGVQRPGAVHHELAAVHGHHDHRAHPGVHLLPYLPALDRLRPGLWRREGMIP